MKHAAITRREARTGPLAENMTRHRARSWDRWIGPWRWTHEAAERDAIRAGEAFRENWGGEVYFAPACRIVTGTAAGPVRPRALLYVLAFGEFDALTH